LRAERRAIGAGRGAGRLSGRRCGRAGPSRAIPTSCQEPNSTAHSSTSRT
jgi:hypothetical protein